MHKADLRRTGARVGHLSNELCLDKDEKGRSSTNKSEI